MHAFLIAAAMAGVGPKAQAASAWTLALGGDVMLNGVPVSAEPLEAVARVFRGADLAVVNLEIPLTTAGTTTSRKSARDIARRAQFVLRADPAHVAAIADAGIDAVTLGNNHAMDYGTVGLSQMLATLDRAGIAHCGAGNDFADAWRPALLGKAGSPRVALISALAFRTTGGIGACTPATTSSPGVAALDLGGQVDEKAVKRIEKLVAKHRRGADLLIVALHWGLEGQTLPTAYQVALGRAFVDAGADLIVGHHPHVLQGAEVYKGKPILYSLGNLVSALDSASAIITVRFQGTQALAFEVAPIRIAGGRASLQSGREAQAGIEAFRALCARVRRAYPNPHAQAPRIMAAR